MIRHALRLFWRTTICLVSFFAVLFAGFMFHEQFSWAQLIAGAAGFLRAREPMNILSGPLPILAYWVACGFVGEMIGRRLDRRTAPADERRRSRIAGRAPVEVA